MRRKTLRGTQILAGLTLMAFLSILLGCSRPKSKPLLDPQQLPPSQVSTDVRTSPPYVLDIGDEVTIKVTDFDEFSKTALIDNSGEIFLPYVGRLKIAGKTVPQARELLTARLKKYIINPQVDVASDASRQRVYVMGEVKSPGVINYRRPLTVMEGLAQAKWFTEKANRSKVLLVRRADNRFHVFRVDPATAFQDGSVAPHAYLQAGDLLYVPPKVIDNVTRFMRNLQTILATVLTAEQIVVLWPSFRDALTGGGAGLSISTTPPPSGTSN